MAPAYVVTGGGRGIGRATVERLLEEGGSVVAIERDPEALAWVEEHPAHERLIPVVGDASSEDVTERAADLAQGTGALEGWVNNAAVFRDASIHSAAPREVMDLISANLAPAVVGSSTAVRRFLAAGTGGAIVDFSSHQAQRAVCGALPYATAKAATEGLIRALAVDYGPRGVRANAVAVGSVATERYGSYLDEQDPAEAARIEDEMRRLHPVGRVGRSDEVAAAIAYLLSDDARFINGAILPVDGGRSALGNDPETRES